MSTFPKDARDFVQGITKYLKKENDPNDTMGRMQKLLGRVSRQAKEEHQAHVESCITLLPSEKAMISRILEQILGHSVALNCTINRSLLGGFRIAVADWVIDTSLSAKLATMSEGLGRV